MNIIKYLKEVRTLDELQMKILEIDKDTLESFVCDVLFSVDTTLDKIILSGTENQKEIKSFNFFINGSGVFNIPYEYILSRIQSLTNNNIKYTKEEIERNDKSIIAVLSFVHYKHFNVELFKIFTFTKGLEFPENWRSNYKYYEQCLLYRHFRNEDKIYTTNVVTTDKYSLKELYGSKINFCLFNSENWFISGPKANKTASKKRRVISYKCFPNLIENIIELCFSINEC
mgnify:FL=1